MPLWHREINHRTFLIAWPAASSIPSSRGWARGRSVESVAASGRRCGSGSPVPTIRQIHSCLSEPLVLVDLGGDLSNHVSEWTIITSEHHEALVHTRGGVLRAAPAAGGLLNCTHGLAPFAQDSGHRRVGHHQLELRNGPAIRLHRFGQYIVEQVLHLLGGTGQHNNTVPSSWKQRILVRQLDLAATLLLGGSNSLPLGSDDAASHGSGDSTLEVQFVTVGVVVVVAAGVVHGGRGCRRKVTSGT
mmetsp:Transcript_41857/g.100569  ORF Transcript_41857/g.100569 Transcript_41857/m.100569 type:complete len:245 (+) Transcript_41857:445-1179(+)